MRQLRYGELFAAFFLPQGVPEKFSASNRDSWLDEFFKEDGGEGVWIGGAIGMLPTGITKSNSIGNN